MFPGAPPSAEPRWAALLDLLTADGACTPGQRAGLLAWPGVNDPGNSATPWPGDLMLASLLQPPDRFSAIVRQLSHVKVSYQPGRPLEAKAYLGWAHTWLLPDGGSAQQAKGRPG